MQFTRCRTKQQRRTHTLADALTACRTQGQRNSGTAGQNQEAGTTTFEGYTKLENQGAPDQRLHLFHVPPVS